jgi:hypothetical protein
MIAARKGLLQKVFQYGSSQYPSFVTVSDVIRHYDLKPSAAPGVQARFRDLRKFSIRVDSAVNTEGIATYRVWPDGKSEQAQVNASAGNGTSATAVNTGAVLAFFNELFPHFVTLGDAAQALRIPYDKINSMYMRLAYQRQGAGGKRNLESKRVGSSWTYRLHPAGTDMTTVDA